MKSYTGRLREQIGKEAAGGMKTYTIRPEVRRRYRVSGMFFLLVAAAVLIVHPAHYALDYQNILVYVFVLMLAVLSLLRPEICRLTLDTERLCFHDGLLGRVTVALGRISKIEWSPKLRIRIHTGGKRAVKIPNVFSPEDTEEIFRAIQKRRPSVEIIRLEPPGGKSGGTEPEHKESKEHSEHD